MINSSQDGNPHYRLPITDYRLLLLLIPFFYLLTLARQPVVGDPTEYTFVAHVLGVAHPPGYAFMAVIGKIYQTLIPLGNIAWRTHLIGATAATVGAYAVYGMLSAALPLIDRGKNNTFHPTLYPRIALFGAGTVAAATNFWQHGIHANPHIVTAMFLALNLFTLTKWYAAHITDADNKGRRWLYAFCLNAGLGVTHHPLTVFALPACALFVLFVYPRILFDWKTLLKGTGFVLLGLLVWLYFPLRSPALAGSTQFVHDMNTLDGFLNLVLARGLRVNLFAFGLSDQWDRLTVFWTLLRLQYLWVVVWLIPFGIFCLASQKRLRPLLILYLGAFALNYIFVMNTVQDVMAYLLGPYLIIGLLIGFGLGGISLPSWETFLKRPSRPSFWRAVVLANAAAVVVIPFTPVAKAAQNLWRGVSLRQYDEVNDYINAVHTRFDGSGEGAVLLNDWEHMTPMWYEQLINEQWFDEVDVRPIFVAFSKPWLEHVFDHLPAGPVYLNRFERSVFDAGFRLRARGAEFYQVVEPGDRTLPPELTIVEPVSQDVALAGSNGEVEIVAYQWLPSRSTEGVHHSEMQRLILAMRAPVGTTDIYAPVVTIQNDLLLPFTTDSHLLSNEWLAGEVIVEMFEFAVPSDRDWRGGQVAVTMQNLTGSNEAQAPQLTVGTLLFGDESFPLRTNRTLANWRQRVGLQNANARVGFMQRRAAPWDNPIVVQSSDTVHITLDWRVLNSPEDSYTIFVHLIDLANRPIIDTLDYTPLGGATPSHLWFPKWLPGQRMLDPYQMDLEGVPPGEYLIEVGIYEQFTKRRLHIHDDNGNINGDRFILGKVIVQP